MSSAFVPLNFTPAAGPVPDVAAAARFTLRAPPRSDIYAQPVPPATFVFNAPAVVRRLPTASFVSARLTVAAAWTRQFDQGGLLFAVPGRAHPHPDAASAAVPEAHPSWIKAGIETNDGVPCVSIVARAPGGWCDWSLLPLFDSPLGTVTSATLEFERYHNALKIFLVRDGGGGSGGDGSSSTRALIRKVPWVFLDGADADPTVGPDALVGVFAAQPDPENESGGEALEVTFSDFVLKTTEDAA